MRRGVSHHRHSREVALTPTCERGRSRRRRDGSIAPACPRCSRLDGTDLPPAARALLSELRHLGRATWAAIEQELPEYDRRSLYRALRYLDRIGRVRRFEEQVEYRRDESWGQRRNGYGSTHPVAAFELILSARAGGNDAVAGSTLLGRSGTQVGGRTARAPLSANARAPSAPRRDLGGRPGRGLKQVALFHPAKE